MSSMSLSRRVKKYYADSDNFLDPHYSYVIIYQISIESEQ